MKLLGAIFAGFLLLVGMNAAQAWPHKEDAAEPETVKSVRYVGSTDLDMLDKVRSDLESATAKDSKIKTLRVEIMSPGGPVITSLEIARVLRSASDKGLKVEIHAVGMCASGCTFVLASGTPGSRYMSRWALFLVHPIQAGNGWGEAVCKSHQDGAKDQYDKAANVMTDLMRDEFMRFTGQSQDTVEDWLTCGHERVGDGRLAVEMKIADKVED